MDSLRSSSSTLVDAKSVENQDAARTVRDATLLTRLMRLAASNRTFNQIVSEFFRDLSEILPADRWTVVEFNAAEPESSYMYGAPGTVDLSLRDWYLALATALKQAQTPICCAGLDAINDAVHEFGLEQAPLEVQSFIAIPLVQQGSVGGALILESVRADSAFCNTDLRLAETLAMPLALILERERAVDDARRRMDQMAAFSAVASTVNEWVDVEQLARRFLAVFLNATATNDGLFYLLESDDEMRLLAQFGVPPELIDDMRLGHVSLHPDLQRVMTRGRLLIVDDVQPAQLSATAIDLALMLQVNTIALLPLRVKGRGIGVVVLGKSEGRIEIADREFVQGLADQAAQAIENARLFSESQRRFEEQSALRELAQRFLSAVSPDEVIERTLDALVSLLPADYYEVLLPDAEGTFVLYNGRGWRRGVVGRTRTVSDPHLHAGYVLRAQLPVIVENFAYETRFQAADYLIRHQVVAGVCAPMLAETRVIGLLGVYSRTARHFTEEQSHFLYLLATQTAIALEKARHWQAAERRLDELVLLNDVIFAANSEVSLDKVLESIRGEIGELLRSDHVQLFFAEDNAGVLQLRPALDTARRPEDANWSKALADWVVRTGEPILIQDLTRDLRFDVPAPEAHACLGAPMMMGERVIGVITVAHPEANTFDKNDLRLLTTLAGQIAAAIERARLLDETAKRLAEISAMFELSNELRTATTESRVMDLVIHAGVQVLHGVMGSLQLLSEDGTQLQVCAVHNMDDLGLAMPREMGGLSWEVYEIGESLAIPDLKSDPRTFQPDRFEGVHGSIIAPLRTPSGILGTMFVGFAECGEPGEDKVRLATTIANLAAQSLQRLRLNEQTQEQAASLAAALNELETSYQATLLALSAALDARDRETEGHSQRVTKFALAIGRQLNLSPDELTSLERGALLHDVGKIGVSDNILLKAGPLTPEERELMNQHPQLGYEMLKDIPFLQDALPVVLYHQEMYDGSGYPAGLRGEEIPLGARIFAVADTYDAMTSTRPYREALSHEKALAEIVRCRGTQFDPKVVDAFIALFETQKQT